MSEFLSMGGYGVFVWGSFAAAVAVFGWNLWAPRAQQRELERQARQSTTGDPE